MNSLGLKGLLILRCKPEAWGSNEYPRALQCQTEVHVCLPYAIHNKKRFWILLLDERQTVVNGTWSFSYPDNIMIVQNCNAQKLVAFQECIHNSLAKFRVSTRPTPTGGWLSCAWWPLDNKEPFGILFEFIQALPDFFEAPVLVKDCNNKFFLPSHNSVQTDGGQL